MSVIGDNTASLAAHRPRLHLQAHPDVMNVLLQLLDDGRVTDSQVCTRTQSPTSPPHCFEQLSLSLTAGKQAQMHKASCSATA
jgi:hypothetical protein